MLFVLRVRDKTATALTLQPQDNLFYTSREGRPGTGIRKHHSSKSASKIDQCPAGFKKKKKTNSKFRPLAARWQERLRHRCPEMQEAASGLQAARRAPFCQNPSDTGHRFFNSSFAFVTAPYFHYIPIQLTRFKQSSGCDGVKIMFDTN